MALMYDQFSYPEIAAIVGKSEETVRKNAERGRTAMKELLGVMWGSVADVRKHLNGQKG